VSGLRLHPSAAPNGRPVYLFAYRGGSMRPTFGEGDLLEILACQLDAVRVGDVIAILPPHGDHLVVHRVTALTPRGLRTRGDNNRGDDNWLLQSEHLIGRVVAAYCGERRRPVPGARVGRLRGRLARWLARLYRAAVPLLSLPYRALARSRLLPALTARLLPASLRPRVVLFRAGDRRWLRLLLGRRAIGRYDPHRARWRIRRPFRVLVDERQLPGIEDVNVKREA
jgi:hypothetical protein